MDIICDEGGDQCGGIESDHILLYLGKAKDPNAPKKPPNAYLQFTLVKR